MSAKLAINTQPILNRSKAGYTPALTLKGSQVVISRMSDTIEIQAPTLSTYKIGPDCLVVLSERACDNVNQAKKVQRALKRRVYQIFKNISA